MFSCGLMYAVWWHIRSAVFFVGIFHFLFRYKTCIYLFYGIIEKARDDTHLLLFV